MYRFRRFGLKVETAYSRPFSAVFGALVCCLLFKMAVHVRHIVFVIGHREPPMKATWWCVHPVKISWSTYTSFQVKRFKFFGRFCLKGPFRPPTIQFCGNLDPLNMICHQRYPRKAHLGVKPRDLSHNNCFRYFICDL